MFEKVNPNHPDKVADRIAGAILDLAYAKEKDPKLAVEVLIGHGKCHIIAETSTHIDIDDINAIVERIVGKVEVDYVEVPQDKHLAKNQKDKFRCGDNGIFKGFPTTDEQRNLVEIAHQLYEWMPKEDGKYLIDCDRLIICQSNVTAEFLRDIYMGAEVNPLGYWTGGINVDCGCTNRKLGSDMGDAVTGGGLHGKDLSKADVSINIYCYLKAQELGKPYELSCAIGDEFVDGISYSDIVEIARCYIKWIGGFEKFAEWGLIR